MSGKAKSYVHRGDRDRRRARVRRGLLLTGFLSSLAYVVVDRQEEATASAVSIMSSSGSVDRLRTELDIAKGELDLAKAQLDRARRVIGHSTRYKISADLAQDIYDIALAEGIEPDLAFRVVKVESEFKERATSPVGAVGLTQLMPATARMFDGTLTKDQMYDRRTNLRIGFRYLRSLVGRYDGDVQVALLVYNRGPVAVNAARAMGIDPRNGYEKLVMNGYKGNGVID
ncbi:MAG: lytic transglycosylase domain-containing protein [Gemmatimonadaceae bacterium]